MSVVNPQGAWFVDHAPASYERQPMVRAHRITADGIEVTMSDGRVLTLTKSRAKADITAASNNLSSARTTSRNRLADAMALTRTFLTVEYDAQGNLTQLEIRYV